MSLLGHGGSTTRDLQIVAMSSWKTTWLFSLKVAVATLLRAGATGRTKKARDQSVILTTQVMMISSATSVHHIHLLPGASLTRNKFHFITEFVYAIWCLRSRLCWTQPLRCIRVDVECGEAKRMQTPYAMTGEHSCTPYLELQADSGYQLTWHRASCAIYRPRASRSLPRCLGLRFAGGTPCWMKSLSTKCGAGRGASDHWVREGG